MPCTTSSSGVADTETIRRPPRRVLLALCVTQVVSWGVLYYAFPVALASIIADTDWSRLGTPASFSAGLTVSALAGIPVGRWLARFGPRRVMTGGSVLAVPATALIAVAPDLRWFLAGWLIAGVAMAAVFDQAAFAALTRWYGPARVRALTTLTLVAGLSSTVFAPLTSLLLDQLSWRATYLVLTGVLALVTIPLHALARTPPWIPVPDDGEAVPAESVRPIVRSPGFLLLSGRSPSPRLASTRPA